MVEIVQATTVGEFAGARALFEEYAQLIGGHLCFQSFNRELETLPEMYGPPSGCLLLALDGDRPAGCVGLRRMPDGACEMKRLYVRPAYRGTGLGRRLAEAVVAQGRKMGYGLMRLDTLESMQAAIALYGRLGFRERGPESESGDEHALHLELRLTPDLPGVEPASLPV